MSASEIGPISAWVTVGITIFLWLAERYRSRRGPTGRRARQLRELTRSTAANSKRLESRDPLLLAVARLEANHLTQKASAIAHPFGSVWLIFGGWVILFTLWIVDVLMSENGHSSTYPYQTMLIIYGCFGMFALAYILVRQNNYIRLNIALAAYPDDTSRADAARYRTRIFEDRQRKLVRWQRRWGTGVQPETQVRGDYELGGKGKLSRKILGLMIWMRGAPTRWSMRCGRTWSAIKAPLGWPRRIKDLWHESGQA